MGSQSRRVGLGAGAFLSGWVCVACGSHGGALGGSGASSGDDEGNPASDAGGGASSGDDASTGMVFTSSDAAPAGVTFECEPGTYTGMFMTQVGSDAGGLASLFSFAWTGTLSITLQGSVMNTSAGEIPLSTLTIAPGAKLSGMDMMGGIFSADLSGMLDCPTKMLTVTVANGTYTDAFMTVQMTGSMTATYDASSGTPELTDGMISVGSPQYASLSADGTWSATLK